MSSPTVHGHVWYKTPSCCCISVPRCNGDTPAARSLGTPHWTKGSRLHTPQGWSRQFSSIPVLQHSSDEPSNGTSVPVSGFIWCCQISSSYPFYLLSYWPPQYCDWGTPVCRADILLPPLSDFWAVAFCFPSGLCVTGPVVQECLLLWLSCLSFWHARGPRGNLAEAQSRVCPLMNITKKAASVPFWCFY